MNRTYDVFSGVPHGEVLWLEAIIGLDEAISRVVQRAQENPGHYFVHDPLTRTIVVSIESVRHGNENEARITRMIKRSATGSGQNSVDS